MLQSKFKKAHLCYCFFVYVDKNASVWIYVVWILLRETLDLTLNFYSVKLFISFNNQKYLTLMDSCCVHIHFLFWPCLVTRSSSASFMTQSLVWPLDQKYSEEFLPDFSQEWFHVASLPPAPCSSLQFSHDMFPDTFPCVVLAAARMWRSGELQSWAKPRLTERLGHETTFYWTENL